MWNQRKKKIEEEEEHYLDKLQTPKLAKLFKESQTGIEMAKNMFHLRKVIISMMMIIKVEEKERSITIKKKLQAWTMDTTWVLNWYGEPQKQ